MNLLAALLASEEHQTHHWLWPERAEIIYGGLASLIVFALLYKYGLPAAKKGFAARTERIQKQMDDATGALERADATASDIRGKLGDIQAERARMLADADAAAEQLLVQGRERLEEEVASLEARAAADIDAGRGRVAGELQAEVAALAADVADRVVRSRIDERVQADLIEQYIANVGSARS
ncbi:MAG TPA: F0F1 ATP synthase subunit B [Acidimicrobiales bacterium]